MKRLFLLALVALVSSCSGCGGAGDDAPAPVQQFGDSTLVHEEVLGELESKVAASILGVKIDNMGVAGSTAGDILSGTGRYDRDWKTFMAQSKARIVTINFGVNDRGAEQYRDNLNALIDIARGAGKTIVLETPSPVWRPGWDFAAHAERVAIMKEVANQRGAPLCDQYTALIDAGLNGPEGATDGMHPSAKGQRFKGEHLATCLKPLLTP